MSTKNESNEAEQGFNDSELLDIMQEIESLEREFASTDQADSEELAIAAQDVKKTSLQDAIDQEMSSNLETSDSSEVEESFEELDQAEMEMAQEASAPNNVVAFNHKPTKAAVASTGAKAPMSFSAEGSMNLALEFDLGETKATLHVNGDQGVTFEMDGVTFTLHPTEGCQVSMTNGVKFSVPVGSASALKKAV